MIIALAVILNLVLVALVTTSIFVGKNNGWKSQVAKLVSLLVCGVGFYFLSVFLTNIILTIPFIITYTEPLSNPVVVICSLAYSILMFIGYGITSLIVGIIRRHNRKKQTGIVNTKIKGIDRKTTRRLRKEAKKLNKLQTEQSRRSKVLGIIFGIVIALILAFMIVTPLKYMLNEIALIKPEWSSIVLVYEYTPFGQLDKVFNLSKIIFKV